MNGLRRSVPLLVSLAFALLLSGCSDSDDPVTPTAPTPPPAATFSVSGTVSETAPTASRRVQGVQVASGSVTATTDSNGAFTLAGVPSGTQSLTFTKADYVTQTLQVPVSATVTGVNVSLAPTPRIVREEHQATIRGDGTSCFGTSRSCHVYQTGAHSDGEVGIFLVWDVNDVNFELEMRCNQEVVDESLAKEPKVLEMRTPVRAGQQCELHVLFTGDTAQYGLFLSYPY